MLLADHHCHIIKKYYPNTLEFLKQLKETSGLEFIWSMGFDYLTNRETLELKEEFNDSFLKVGIGFHPSNIIEMGDEALYEFEKIKELIIENKTNIDFIGEIGIDFSYPDSRKHEKKQLEIFRELYELAQELKLPVSIHCRDAWKELMKVIDKSNVKMDTELESRGFLHSFTGTFDQGVWCIENGFKLGLNGIVTFKKSEELRETIKELMEFYSDREFDEIFGLETDSPYLAPDPFRGKDNSPENVKVIADYLKLLIS